MHSLSELAKRLGINKGYLSRLSKRSWFPRRGESGWADVDEVRKAIDANVERRSPCAGVSGKPSGEDLKSALSNLADKKPLLFFIPAGVSEISIHIKVTAT